MDAILQARAEQLATEFANQHHTAEDLNGLIRLRMKTALERMLNTELDVHLGRRAAPPALTAAESREAAANREPAAAAAKAGKPNRRNGHSRKTVQGKPGPGDDFTEETSVAGIFVTFHLHRARRLPRVERRRA